MYCKKCVLPDHEPEIQIGEDGICDKCLDHDKLVPNTTKNILLESELVKLLDKYRGKRKYDCLVMCSGGKDSTSSLYYMKKRYKLNPMAFTFDNGFEHETAIDNVKTAVEILGVDWYYYKSSFMTDMFAEMVKTGSKFPVCPLCSLWYMQKVYSFAEKYDIRLVIGGWTSGQLSQQEVPSFTGDRLLSKDVKSDLQTEMELLCSDIPEFVQKMRQKYPKYNDFPCTMEEVQKKYKNSRKTMIISPHWFLPVEPDEYTEIIKKELNWKPLDFSYPADSTNCVLNYLGSYLSMQKYGYTHFHIEMSKLIRSGKLSKEEALVALKMDINNGPGSKTMDKVLNILGCTREDLKNSV